MHPIMVPPNHNEHVVVSAPVLATKLYIPVHRAKLVLRPRLIERLNEGLYSGRTPGVTLISASAGFGKTTLVSEWIASLAPNLSPAGTAERVAWLSLDEGDNDPRRFLTYLVAALQTIHVNIGTEVLDVLQAAQSQSLPIESILTTLINEITAIEDNPSTRLHQSGQRFILVLDDYHVIDSKFVDNALAFLIEHLPPQMHLVIATREDPHLPLARLRVRGQVTELRAANLRFTPTEAAEFLNQMMGLNLSAEDVAALETRTEGWIAGLQLAALSMQGQRDAASFIKAFTGSHHFVLDYLMEEVLGQQSEDVQNFLFRTSILNRMCGSLCDAVLRSDAPSASGQETLEYLERTNLFIVPLDNERGWYRYHHLFAELLRHRLEQTSPALAPKLHHRASVWLENENLIEEAIAHGFASCDWEHTANLILHFAHRVHIQTNLTALGSWLAALPEPVIRARPWLCVYQALAWYWTGPRDRIEERLQLAEQALPGSQIPELEVTHLAGYIAAIRAHYALVSGDIPRVLAMAQAALKQLPEGDYMRGWTAVALGGAYWGQGDVAASQQAFQTAKTVALQHNYRLLAVPPACYVGMQLVKQGKLDEALCVYREGMEYATVAGDQQLPIAGFPKVKLGDVLRERNDLTGAEQWLRSGVEQCLQLGHPDVLVDAYAALTRLQLAQNDWPGAHATFQRADELAHKSPVDPFVRCWLDDCRVRLWLAKGRLDDLGRWAEASELRVDGELSYHYDLHHLNLARLLLARARFAATSAGRHAYLSQVSGLLARLLVAAEKAGWVHETIKTLVLQTLVMAESNDKDMALQTLGRALTLAEPGGFIRIFVDEGEPMRLLILDFRHSTALAPVASVHRAADEVQALSPEKPWRNQEPMLIDYVNRILSAFPQPAAPQSKIQDLKSEIVEPLSQRELEILRLIAQGLSNRQISERLFLALSTVKGHTRILFDKLQVQRRTEAVARARELGLL